MSGIFSTAGSKFFIGGPQPLITRPLVESDFSDQSFVEVGWVENLGQFGDESSAVTFASIGDARMQKLKGVRDAGTISLVCGLDYSDAGQFNLRSAEADPGNWAFKVQFNDAPVGGTPSLRYFVGQVMSVREQLDGANSVMKLNASVGINSNVVRVNATA